MVDVVLRSVAWTFAKKPLRRYDLYPDGALVERPLSFPNVLLAPVQVRTLQCDAAVAMCSLAK